MDASHGKTGIQVGYYQLKKKMAAEDAFDVLINPKHILTTTVTIPEGLRVADIVAILAAKTKFSDAAVRGRAPGHRGARAAVVRQGQPGGLPLPVDLRVRAEGDSRPTCSRTWSTGGGRRPTRTASLAGAKAQGKTPGELMTIASLVQAEGRGSDMPKVARVIYNRLDGPGDQGGTNGLLQIDATVNYALDRKGVVAVTTDEAHNTQSPYNTYIHPGLPPGPIDSPGDEAIKAALNPADGPWFYYVTVNLRTGETKFATTYQRVPAVQAGVQPVLPDVGRLLRTWACAAPSSVTRSSTRCRRCCTGRRTSRSGWTGRTTRSGCRAAGSRTSSAGSTTSGAGCR